MTPHNLVRMWSVVLSVLFAAPSRDGNQDGDAMWRRRAELSRPRGAETGHSVGASKDHREGGAVSPEDAALLARMKAGDAAAFETLFRQHYASLHDFASAWCGMSERADEIVSDVFLWLYEHRDTVQPRTSLASYLYGAVRHRAFNARRSDNRSELRHHRLASESHASVVPQRNATPEEVYLDNEQRAVRVRSLVRALAPLSQTSRSIFLLRLQSGLSYAEIASIIGISANAAKTQFSRALAAVRQTISVAGGSESNDHSDGPEGGV